MTRRRGQDPPAGIMATDQSAGSAFDQSIARIAVGAYDDMQDVRTAMMNRIRDLVRKRNEGIPMDAVEDEKDPDDRDYDDKYSDDNLPDIIDQMLAENKLSRREYDYLTDVLETATTAAELEQQYQNIMKVTLSEPIYTEWLDNVYGVSHTLTARLIYRFGYCTEFEKVSNLWSYSGLAPGQTRTRGEQLNYDPQAKTLAWLVADNMVRQGSNSQYRVEFYDPYKQKQLNRMEKAEEMSDEELADVDWSPPNSKAHADNRARRYLGKKFLKHYWYIARDLKGLETPDEWVITHGGHDKREDTFENPAYAKRELMGD